MAEGMGGMLARASERTPQANKALHASGFHQHFFVCGQAGAWPIMRCCVLTHVGG